MNNFSTPAAACIRHPSILAAFLAAVLFAGSPGEARAQGLFDLFGGSQRAAAPAAPAQSLAHADPVAPPSSRRPAHPTTTAGRTVAYCVRLCDGRHFPIQHHNAATPVQLCSALCPASQTKIFSGSDISRAVAKDGTRYAALENAFAYRTRLVADCTCNGKDSFGLAPIDISADPTLRAGDIVATDGGQVAFAGSKSNR
jgi:Protein of unknown function (DUF2865)